MRQITRAQHTQIACGAATLGLDNAAGRLKAEQRARVIVVDKSRRGSGRDDPHAGAVDDQLHGFVDFGGDVGVDRDIHHLAQLAYTKGQRGGGQRHIVAACQSRGRRGLVNHSACAVGAGAADGEAGHTGGLVHTASTPDVPHHAVKVIVGNGEGGQALARDGAACAHAHNGGGHGFAHFALAVVERAQNHVQAVRARGKGQRLQQWRVVHPRLGGAAHALHHHRGSLAQVAYTGHGKGAVIHKTFVCRRSGGGDGPLAVIAVVEDDGAGISRRGSLVGATVHALDEQGVALVFGGAVVDEHIAGGHALDVFTGCECHGLGIGIEVHPFCRLHTGAAQAHHHGFGGGITATAVEFIAELSSGFTAHLVTNADVVALVGVVNDDRAAGGGEHAFAGLAQAGHKVGATIGCAGQRLGIVGVVGQGHAHHLAGLASGKAQGLAGIGVVDAARRRARAGGQHHGFCRADVTVAGHTHRGETTVFSYGDNTTGHSPGHQVVVDQGRSGRGDAQENAIAERAGGQLEGFVAVQHAVTSAQGHRDAFVDFTWGESQRGGRHGHIVHPCKGGAVVGLHHHRAGHVGGAKSAHPEDGHPGTLRHGGLVTGDRPVEGLVVTDGYRSARGSRTTEHAQTGVGQNHAHRFSGFSHIVLHNGHALCQGGHTGQESQRGVGGREVAACKRIGLA